MRIGKFIEQYTLESEIPNERAMIAQGIRMARKFLRKPFPEAEKYSEAGAYGVWIVVYVKRRGYPKKMFNIKLS